MKRLLLFAALLAWLAGGLSAQNPNHQHSLDAMTRSLFERLDKNSLQSGILLQQSAMFVNPFRFDGTVLNDSNQMDASRFGKLFGQLRAASVGQPALPDPVVNFKLATGSNWTNRPLFCFRLDGSSTSGS
ncbi:MAG: hypothetical protein OHK0019_35600 [Saprospiraceae bacterium]